MEQHSKHQGLSEMWGGKQLLKCVKWLQLFVEMQLCTLHIFEWFKILR